MSEPMTYVEEGTLAPPGPIGRLARALSGFDCAFFLYFLILHRHDILSGSGIVNFGWLVGIAFAVYVFPDVISLGFGKSWSRKTILFALLGAVIIVASVGWIGFKSPLSPPLGTLIFVWLAYTVHASWVRSIAGKRNRLLQDVKCVRSHRFGPEYPEISPGSICVLVLSRQ